MEKDRNKAVDDTVWRMLGGRNPGLICRKMEVEMAKRFESVIYEVPKERSKR